MAFKGIFADNFPSLSPFQLMFFRSSLAQLCPYIPLALLLQSVSSSP